MAGLTWGLLYDVRPVGCKEKGQDRVFVGYDECIPAWVVLLHQL